MNLIDKAKFTDIVKRYLSHNWIIEDVDKTITLSKFNKRLELTTQGKVRITSVDIKGRYSEWTEWIDYQNLELQYQ